MKSDVIWSPRAENEFNLICSYLFKEWGKEVTLKFIDIVEKNISYISAFPFMFPAFGKKPNVRKCVLNKYTYIALL